MKNIIVGLIIVVLVVWIHGCYKQQQVEREAEEWRKQVILASIAGGNR